MIRRYMCTVHGVHGKGWRLIRRSRPRCKLCKREMVHVP